MTLQVMTYNIHHGVGVDNIYDLHRIADVIKKSDADLIGLNEVDVHFSKRSRFDHQMKCLADDVGYYYAFAPAIQKQSIKQSNMQKKKHQLREFGNGLLSRFPIINVQNHVVYGLISENRSILEADIDFKGIHLKTFVSHFSLNPFMHRKQRRLLLDQVSRSKQPVIVMGDWNMLPNGKAWREVNKELQDSSLEKNGEKLFTFSSTRPIIQLDFIFVNNSFRVLKTKCCRINWMASDHLPIVSSIKLK